MLKRTAAVAVAAASLFAGTVATAPAALADLCTPVPLTTQGVTVGAAGKEVRVPAISNVAVCIWSNDSYGSILPELRPGAGCGDPCYSFVFIHWNLHWDYGIRYTADGQPRELRADMPPVPTGGPGELCVFSVGAPADTSCLTYVSLD